MANIFLTNPVNIQAGRSVFTGKPKKLAPMNYGRLYPIRAFVVQPGDSIEMNLAARIRGATPIAPVMGDSYMEYAAFYVPWRIIWNSTKQYFGENDSTAWTQSSIVTKPKLTLQMPIAIADADVPNDANKHRFWHAETNLNWETRESDMMLPNKLADYLGFNPGLNSLDNTAFNSAGLTRVRYDVSPLKFRAYWQIWNDYFRDENYIPPLVFSKSNTQGQLKTMALPYDYYRYNPTTQGYSDELDTASDILFVCKKQDPFTTILPEPTKGPNINLLQLNGPAPVGAFSTTEHNKNQQSLLFRERVTGGANGTIAKNAILATASDAALSSDGTLTSSSIASKLNITNLYADLSGASAITIEAIRLAAATTQYYEALARGGSRYNEYIRAIFGVTPSDASIQRAEILGVHSQVITQYAITQTSGETSANGTSLGDVGAMSFSVHHSNSLIKKGFDEWGIVMVCAFARIERNYSNAMDPEDKIFDMLDEYAPQFDHVGDQPLMASDIEMKFYSKDLQSNNYYKDFIFGYQEAFWYKRFHLNQACGILNPTNPNSLSYWTYGTNHVGTGSFQTQFIAPGPTWQLAFEDEVIVDNTLQLGKQASGYAQQLLGLFEFDEKFYRVMNVRSIPGMTRI